jgi:hypothetical protein
LKGSARAAVYGAVKLVAVAEHARPRTQGRTQLAQVGTEDAECCMPEQAPTCIKVCEGLVKVKHQQAALLVLIINRHAVLNKHLNICWLLYCSRSCCLGRRCCRGSCSWLLLLPEAVGVAVAFEPVHHVEAALQHTPHIRRRGQGLQECMQQH